MSFEKFDYVSGKTLKIFESKEKGSTSPEFDSFSSSDSPIKRLGNKICNTEINERGSSISRTRRSCLQCMKLKADQLDEKKELSLMKEKLLVTETQLKQYDSLLVIKEKQLRDEENLIKSDRFALEEQKAEFETMKEKELRYLKQKMTELYEEKKLIDEKSTKISEMSDSDHSLKVVHSRFRDTSLVCDFSLTSSRDMQVGNKKLLTEPSTDSMQTRSEKELEIIIKELTSKMILLDSEILRVSKLKSELESKMIKKDDCIKISSSLDFQPVCNGRLLTEREEALKEKEKTVENLMNNLNEEQQRLQERWASIENIENIIKNLEFYKNKAEKLELMQRSTAPLLNSTEKTAEIALILSKKLENLNRREKELADFEKKLNDQNDELAESARIVAELNEALKIQKENQDREQMIIQETKNRLQQVVIMQDERQKLLDLREFSLRQN